jgi:Cu(I)/Ag(I) efflux system membrane protein CusA/SilA
MIGNLIEYCVRHRFIVILLTVLIAVWGVYCVMRTPIDAIPDLSENQVIVFTDWMGRSPQEIDDQITYPLSVNLQGLAGIKAVRSASEFNFSMINIIFDDKTDFYFARQRVLERLNIASTFLPPGVVPYLAPDATALGQIFWYTVEGDGYSLDELRAIQDWYVRYQLYVSGVAEVASVGGFVREYQIDVDPDKLRAFEIPLGTLFDAVARSNMAVGGKVYFESNAEYLIRGVGWLRGVKDLENVVVAQRQGAPLCVRNLAAVQLGPEYRRSMLEKNGAEAVGGVVLMRYGENPLAVTKAVKDRIQQLQSGLPAGVRIVPFYDRTSLIEGAIHTLTRTLTEELIIASIAILLILTHVRSAFVVCVTLPLAVLVSFILMYYLGIPSNIMSLSGIAISIGILVDAAVVMVENATHELTRRFGHGQKITGDTTDILAGACRLVGKPIFFAVVIMLVSFLPVFALGGQEGKMFHPLAFTKSFAMVGVAILAVTFVPAVIPLFIRGRLRSEEDNWIVRSFINIYKPVLTWLMRVPAAGIWFMGFLFIVGAGFIGSHALFTAVLAAALFFGSVFFRKARSQALAFVLLAAAAVWAHDFPKLGREFMPPLDEGSILDMPVTVPRVSITQAADDIRVRDAVMAGFPEVERVVGKVGRADTPTDPSGIDMVETIVTLRPKEWWPKRKIRYEDALAAARDLIGGLQEAKHLPAGLPSDRIESLANGAAMDAMARLDRFMRDLAHHRQNEFQPVLAKRLVAAAIQDLLDVLRTRGRLKSQPTATQIEQLAGSLSQEHGLRLVEAPRQEEMTNLLTAVAEKFAAMGAVDLGAELLSPPVSAWRQIKEVLLTATGGEKPTLSGELLERFQDRMDQEWVRRIKLLNWELEDAGIHHLVVFLLDDLSRRAQQDAFLTSMPAEQALADIAARWEPRIHKRTFLWHKLKADIVKEMDSELQVPGWGNIWTQPIINRVDMLATGVRTMIGVKVYGPRLADETEEVVENGLKKTVVKPGIQSVANAVAGVLRGVPGAVDVFPDQIVGRSYLTIEIDRERAARYGINVGDLQDTIEVAMGGKAITTTVEGRRRFPVRVRYARDFWQTEEALRRILVTGRRGTASVESAGEPSAMQPSSAALSKRASGAAMTSGEAVQIPISDVADIQVIEGPSVIKSENGQLRAYVQLNVRDRDIIGFVEEAQQAVDAKLKEMNLPPGFSVEWSGQFEHQVRARKTLQLVFPMVVLIIFILLYVTFNDLRDALLIILAVPGALIGGVIFQSLFGFHFSVAVWVGYIACFGMATQTGIVMLVYLHEALNARGGLAKIASLDQLREAVITGAVHRLRPKLMTEGVAIVGLMPMLWATGVGAEVMRPMAAPVLGGLLIADEVIDLLLPVIFNWYQSRRWRRMHQA